MNRRYICYLYLSPTLWWFRRSGKSWIATFLILSSTLLCSTSEWLRFLVLRYLLLKIITINPRVTHTFAAINYQQATRFIKQHTPNPEHRNTLLDILQHRSPDDGYYQAQYRVNDYHVIRRLRALGAEVEVFLPWALRERIALDLQETGNHYRHKTLTL